MNQDRIETYKLEITQWISKQGFLFQLFQAPRLLGSSAGVVSFLVGLFFKVLAIALLAGLVYFFFVATSHTKSSFTEKVNEKIKTSLKADEVVLANAGGGLFSPIQIPELNMKGGGGSFFETLNLQNVSFNVGNLAAKKKIFNAESVSCSKLEADIKISAVEGESIFTPLFEKQGWFRFNDLEVRKADLSWGYSARTKGVIKGTSLTMSRQGSAWLINLSGGSLSYSWLKEVEIEDLTLLVKKDHFEISEANFKKNGAKFTLNLKVDKFGVSPLVSGGGEIYNCNVHDILKEDYKAFISGEVNAGYTLNGSPNSPEGLFFKFIPLVTKAEAKGVNTQVVHPNLFKLTHKIPIWRALTTLESTLDYTAYVFDETSWVVELRGDQISVSDAKLSNKTDKRLNLGLSFAIKEPSKQYIENAVAVSDAGLKSILQRSGMKEKARELLKLKGTITELNVDSLERSDYAQLLRSERHFDGEAILRFTGESFPSKDRIHAAYPVGSDGMRSIKVPLVGPTGQITETTAKALYDLGRKQ